MRVIWRVVMVWLCVMYDEERKGRGSSTASIVLVDTTSAIAYSGQLSTGLYNVTIVTVRNKLALKTL